MRWDVDPSRAWRLLLMKLLYSGCPPPDLGAAPRPARRESVDVALGPSLAQGAVRVRIEERATGVEAVIDRLELGRTASRALPVDPAGAAPGVVVIECRLDEVRSRGALLTFRISGVARRVAALFDEGLPTGLTTPTGCPIDMHVWAR